MPVIDIGHSRCSAASTVLSVLIGIYRLACRSELADHIDIVRPADCAQVEIQFVVEKAGLMLSVYDDGDQGARITLRVPGSAYLRR